MNKIKIKDLKQIKKLSYTSKYFIKTKMILNCMVDNNLISTMQFICFNDEDIMVCGISECVEIIKQSINKKYLKDISVYGLVDGDVINKNTPILKIVGNYQHFCWLENILIGIITSRSSVATNCYNVLKQLKPDQELIYMADRCNSYINQEYDGYAAYVAGVRNFTTKKQIEYINDDKSVKLVGTIPHALIQQFDNDLNKLIIEYNKHYDDLILLIDYDNDVISTLNKIKSNMHLIKGVRIDTSKALIDKSLDQDSNNYGVNNALIKLVQDWLNINQFHHVKIYISSSMTVDSISNINSVDNQVYGIGVGSYLLTNCVNISADLVSLNNKPQSKFGRSELHSDKLKKYL